MSKNKTITTPAVRVLKTRRVNFLLHSYKYEDNGGASAAARAFNLDKHQVIKTLVMEGDPKQYFLVLMHGDRQVSVKALARFLKIKTVTPCEPEIAQKITGYKVGGISPFGIRKALAVYLESSIMALDTIYINAGKRGIMAQLAPGALVEVVNPVMVTVGI
ncbi:MAG: aminoacyl-tRNA deacylase [Desulfobacteraceae bacterium 4572_123]|nr:MAG: aminoacyl-tRNA deacylase [Desulfobacteraceae bacterium 4572_123]